MIFQQTVPITVEGQEVYAVFDIETGLVGFVKVDGEQEDYTFAEAPVEYRVALSNFLEANSGGCHKTNTKICRKGDLGRHVLNYLHKIDSDSLS